MRHVLLTACIGILLATAGCLASDMGTGDDLDPASEEAAALTLDQGLTMDGAETVEQTEDRIVFSWQAEVEADGSETTQLEVPEGIPFTVEMTLEPDGEIPLWLLTESTDATLCDGATSEGEVACKIPALPREDAQSWDVTVQRDVTEAYPTEPTAFEVTVEVSAGISEDHPSTPSLLQAPDDHDHAHDPGWPDIDDATIRPGVKVGGEICTANFIFQSPDNGTLYIGTASHCVAAGGTHAEGYELGQPIDVAKGAVEGRVVYCSWGASEKLLSCPYKYSGDEGRADDFALIEIPAHQRDQVHPAMLVWGGPTSVGEAPSQGTLAHTYGNTNLRDQGQDVNVADSRPGVVAESETARTSVYFTPSSVWGDSGSPVIQEDGSTIGTLVSISQNPPGAIEAVNLDHSLSKLEGHTGDSVVLATWPLFETPRTDKLPHPSPPLAR